MARNAFLDGNLYYDSFYVKKESYVGDWIYGLALSFGDHVEIGLTRAVRTREFVLQKGYDRIGSIMVKGKWAF